MIDSDVGVADRSPTPVCPPEGGHGLSEASYKKSLFRQRAQRSPALPPPSEPATFFEAAHFGMLPAGHERTRLHRRLHIRMAPSAIAEPPRPSKLIRNNRHLHPPTVFNLQEKAAQRTWLDHHLAHFVRPCCGRPI